MIAWSVVVVPLLAPRSADAQQQTPKQALKAFIATLNQHRPDCSLMAADLREAFTEPVLAGQSKFSVGRLATDADRLAVCGSAVAIQQRGTQRIRTILAGASVRERSDTVARLRVHVRLRFLFLQDEDLRITVWMERENGAWKLATSRELLQTAEDGASAAPSSLRQWQAYRRRLAARAARHRAEQQRQAQSARDLTSTVASQPLTCEGRSSQATDPARDVVWSSGMDPVPDQGRPTIDMLAGSLRSLDGTYCWELRFTRPPGPTFDISVGVSRRSSVPAPRDAQPVEFHQGVVVHVENGTALADIDTGDWWTVNFRPVEVSQTADVVRVKLTRGDLFHSDGPFDGRHDFRWEVESFEDNPTGVDDASNWMDELAGALHSP